MTGSPTPVPEDDYTRRIRACVQQALNSGTNDFMGVLAISRGADPRVVHAMWNELRDARARPQAQVERALSASLPWVMPASDPELAQWWFAVTSIEYLTRSVMEELPSGDGLVVCLGVPTLAARLASNFTVRLLDIDGDVIEAVEGIAPPIVATCYDARSPLPNDILGSAAVVLADAPWYLGDLKTFITRSVEACAPGALILTTLPPILTRPDIAADRSTLIARLVEVGISVEGLEAAAVEYLVPRFEEHAFQNLEGFSPRIWRHGDLLRIRVPEAGVAGLWQDISPAHKPPRVFSRNSTEFRVFLRGTAALTSTSISAVEQYSKNVSRRLHGDELVDTWTSDKQGARISNIKFTELVLESWSRKRSLTDSIEDLIAAGVASEDARIMVEAHDAVLKLWSRYSEGSPRRTAEQMAEARVARREKWAAEPSPREHGAASDGFRLEFQRDRDRVLWSPSFRRLATKTQLFPVQHGDEVRQRLAHSIEVKQLASTVGEAFGLDEELIEAGALAHDIGHTPYGHAGEVALDRLLKDLGYEPGFNHYEHGVDVVRYLDESYSYSSTSHLGLNLTPEVSECIFKHTYCQTSGELSHDAIRRTSKHQSYLQAGYCHLEGQAVRFADKLSYLISDLEDGVLVGAVHFRNLSKTRLFNRAPIDLLGPLQASLLERFVLQRRSLIKLIMEDAIRETSRRLARLGGKSPRRADDYSVAVSPEVQADMDEIWRDVQAGLLHKNPQVIQANAQAARRVSELAVLLAVVPELVEERFRLAHARLGASSYIDHYRSMVGTKVTIPAGMQRFLPLDHIIGMRRSNLNGSRDVDVTEMVLAKDYVASLSDSRATELHQKLIAGTQM